MSPAEAGRALAATTPPAPEAACLEAARILATVEVEEVAA